MSNALFLATGSGATGTQFQRFVKELWANQDPGGPGPVELRELRPQISSSEMS